MDDAAAIKARAKKNIASARLLRDEAALIKSARVKLNKIADGLNNSPPTNATKITHKAYAKELSNILIDSNVALRIQAYILEKRSIPDYNTIIKDFVRGEANKAGFFSGEKSSPGELDAAWDAYQLRHPDPNPPTPTPPTPTANFNNKEEYMNFLEELRNYPKYKDEEEDIINGIISIAEEVYDGATPNNHKTYIKNDVIVNFNSLLSMAKTNLDKFTDLVRGAATRRAERKPRGGRRRTKRKSKKSRR